VPIARAQEVPIIPHPKHPLPAPKRASKAPAPGPCAVGLALLLLSGCTATPRLEDYTHREGHKAPRIIGPDGLLSPRASQAIMNRLAGQAEPTDILERQTRVVEGITGSSLVTGNKVTLLIDGPATYAAMLEAMQAARTSIHFETYIIEDDAVGRQFAALLLRKQAEGVEVDFLYDSVGCLDTPAPFFQSLRDGGIQVREFNPVNPARMRGGKWLLTQRDHRKLLIVDGAVAFTGGVNISAVYSSILHRRRSSPGADAPQHSWRDTDVQIDGPAVADMQRLFLETWAREQGPAPVQDPFPPLKPAGNDLLRIVGSTPGTANRFTYLMYVSAFACAEQSIHLTTPYFVPDAQMLKVLRHAAERGLDVKIILPGVSDAGLLTSAGRFYYARLLKSGVKLYERRHDSMMHAKTAVIDGVWSTVGSTNMESMSFLNNDEVNAVVLSREFAARMEVMFADDLKESYQIQPAAWKRRPLGERLREWSASLLGRWM
jgi:cardiolipin synthase